MVNVVKHASGKYDAEARTRKWNVGSIELHKLSLTSKATFSNCEALGRNVQTDQPRTEEMFSDEWTDDPKPAPKSKTVGPPFALTPHLRYSSARSLIL
jgi:hypothetical protein